MKVGWETVSLKDVCTLINGKAYKKIELLSEGKYKVLRVGNFFTNRSWYFSDLELPADKYCDDGDLLYAWSASFGPQFWKGGKTIYHYHIWKVEVDRERILKKFLYYFFEWDKEKIQSEQGAGTTMIHVSMRSMNSRELALPPLEEQKRIVGILDEAFAGIDQAIANTEKNLQNAKDLFEGYLNNIFTQKGEGWADNTIGGLAEIEYGYTDKAGIDGDYRYVRITDIDNNGQLIECNKKYVLLSPEIEKFILKDNDLLMARTGATFAKLLLYKDVEPSIFASYLIRINFRAAIKNELYWFFSKTPYYWQQANSLSSGAAQPHFNGTALKQMKFSYPISMDEQNSTIQLFRNIFKETQNLENIHFNKLTALKELKQSLLQKAFAGELTSDAKQVA